VLVLAFLGMSGPVWDCLGLPGPVCPSLGFSGLVQACLGFLVWMYGINYDKELNKTLHYLSLKFFSESDIQINKDLFLASFFHLMGFFRFLRPVNSFSHVSQ
jgi:hypothetical protein